MIAAGEFQSATLASRTAGEPAYFSAWGLQAFYGQSYIVQDVSFNVHEGEIVALLGRNGAGKTSTLRTLARPAQPHLAPGEIRSEERRGGKVCVRPGRLGRAPSH